VRASTLLFFIFFLVNNFYAFSQVDTINYKASSEGYKLDVQLLKYPSITKAPAIIFLVGSGSSASHKTNYKDFVKFFLEDNFLIENYVLVYFDKRGVGNSEGKWYETTFEQRALDAKNVALSLTQFEFIDTSNIFLIGHSQGAWITQIALAEYPDIFAGGISMAGATFGVKKQMINDYMNEYICEDNYSKEKAVTKATNKVNRDFFFISFLGIFGINDNWSQLKIIKDFEPKPYLKRICKPLLLLFGENDMLVDYQWCLEELKLIFGNDMPKHIEIYLAKDENHSFKVAPKCYQGKWSDIYYSVNTKSKIKQWIEYIKNSH